MRMHGKCKNRIVLQNADTNEITNRIISEYLQDAQSQRSYSHPTKKRKKERKKYNTKVIKDSLN